MASLDETIEALNALGQITAALNVLADVAENFGRIGAPAMMRLARAMEVARRLPQTARVFLASKQD